MEKNIPIISTYHDLESHIKSWAKGYTSYLCIIGPGGMGKTTAYERLDIDHHLFRGKTTAYTIFEVVEDAPNRPIIFDDITALLRDPTCRDLLKQLCDTKPNRVIRWSSKGQQQSFTCNSSVLIILNSIPKNDPDLSAILDRFDVNNFQPTKSEVLGMMKKIAIDPSDVELFAELPILPSLRILKLYEQWKESPYLNAIEKLVSVCGVSDEIKLMMQVLESTPKGKQVAEYQRMSGKSYDAAKKEWGRKHKIAQQLVDAKVVKKKSA